MKHRRIPFAAALLALVAGAAPSGAQTVTPQSAVVAGCRGYSFNSRTDESGLPIDYPVLTELQPGSPAERAGLRVGDLYVAQNGVSVFAWTPPGTRPPAPGDTVVMRVRRDGRELDVPVVVGRRDPPKSRDEVGLCRPVATTTP